MNSVYQNHGPLLLPVANMTIQKGGVVPHGTSERASANRTASGVRQPHRGRNATAAITATPWHALSTQVARRSSARDVSNVHGASLQNVDVGTERCQSSRPYDRRSTRRNGSTHLRTDPVGDGSNLLLKAAAPPLKVEHRKGPIECDRL